MQGAIPNMYAGATKINCSSSEVDSLLMNKDNQIGNIYNNNNSNEDFI